MDEISVKTVYKHITLQQMLLCFLFSIEVGKQIVFLANVPKHLYVKIVCRSGLCFECINNWSFGRLLQDQIFLYSLLYQIICWTFKLWIFLSDYRTHLTCRSVYPNRAHVTLITHVPNSYSVISISYYQSFIVFWDIDSWKLRFFNFKWKILETNCTDWRRS